jgi:hypothetical protein
MTFALHILSLVYYHQHTSPDASNILCTSSLHLRPRIMGDPFLLDTDNDTNPNVDGDW